MLAGWRSISLVDVRNPVLVVVAVFLLPQLAVVPVADPQEYRGEHRGDERAGRTATFTWSSASELPPKASSPINNDTVKPMPPRIATPVTSGHVSPFCRGCLVAFDVR